MQMGGAKGATASARMLIAALLLGIDRADGAGDLADAVDAQWHPPSSNFWDVDLDQTLKQPGSGSLAFDASAAAPAGGYNYCNMPHVRPAAAEYQRPKGAYKLEYVEVIQRHHKRTPYKSNLVRPLCPPPVTQRH